MRLYQKCIPDGYYQSIYAIDFEALKETGIKAILFDLDNTIISYRETSLPPLALDLINHLRTNFKVLIISNSTKPRVKAAALDIPYVSFARKPLKVGFKKALKMLSVHPNETILIGDQLMTDILGAHRMKMKAFLVEAVSRKTDKFYTKINRVIEKRILKKIRKKCPDLYDQYLGEYEQKNFVKHHQE